MERLMLLGLQVEISILEEVLPYKITVEKTAIFENEDDEAKLNWTEPIYCKIYILSDL